MYTKLSASRAYVYAVARAADAGKVSREDCAGAILLVSDHACEVAMDAQQCFGGNGYINGVYWHQEGPKKMNAVVNMRRLRGRPPPPRRAPVHCWRGHAGDPPRPYWSYVQRGDCSW